MTVSYHERQPARPRWLPLALETQVDGERLRFRTARRGRWREIPLSDIEGVEVVRLGVWSWPVGYQRSFGGEETYSVLSGKGVRLRLGTGRVLTLGTRDPEGLRRVLQPFADG